MPGYEIRPFDEQSLPEMGPFLSRSIEALTRSQGSSGNDESLPSNRLGSGSDYRWLLDEDNPARQEGIPAGEIIRNDQGAIMGIFGFHPVYFRLGDQRLLGLGGHNFFVDPSARMQGFIMFRRYLNYPKADFCYTTSCNNISSQLWAKCGGAQLPDSDSEYVLVLRYGPILKELAIKKGVPRAAAAPLLLAGPLAGLIFGPRRKRSGLKCERCDDWERLSAIAEQHRDPTRLTPDRTASVLAVKYEAMCRNGKATGSLDGVYHFTDSSGHEGWFGLGEKTRGSAVQMRSLSLTDAVWPRSSLEFSCIIHAVVELAGSRCDFLSIRDRSAWGLRSGLLSFRRRILPAPEAFVHSKAGSGLRQPAEFAQIADFPPAFGV
jgi:hypothetical protein